MIRLPDGWRDVIKIRAANNRRSMNQEILAALECVVSEAATGKGFADTTPAAAEQTGARQGANPII